MTSFIEKLFRRKKESAEAEEVSSEAITIPSQPWPEDVTKPLSPMPGMSLAVTGDKQLEPPQLIAGCAQSTGRQRDHNEDALFSLTTTMANNASNLAFGLYIVADGMGGHQHGEVASEIATRSMSEHIIRNLYTPLFSVNPLPLDETLQEIMQTGVQKAHNAIMTSVAGGGTTLTAVLILGSQMIIAHVGDSRVYSIHFDGSMKALTRDHSLVKRLEELGQLTPEEAAIHPQRNVLYRALGQGEPFDPEIVTDRIPRPGYLLICSDGLWGVVHEEKISKIIIESSTPQEACKEMVDAANEAGGPDNITAILVKLPS
jgi:serine/threonine protein phosphatase PrpC